jgi:tetratricopeptide (TPR) repeat protein
MTADASSSRETVYLALGGRMRRRRRSIAPWLFVLAGFLLVLAGAVALVVWLEPDARFSKVVTERLKVPEGNGLDVFVKLGGLCIGAIGTALTLLAGWHFLEMNLPRRIEELKDYHSQDHLVLRPQLLAIAKQRLRFVPEDIESSRFTLLRRWWSTVSVTEQTRLLAATATRLHQEAAALSAAAREAQHQTITAYLVRGYQYVAAGERVRAFTEFELAARVSATDIYSRDVAAGWARCINDQARELELLHEIQKIAGDARSYVEQARAFRREAELIRSRNNGPAYIQALARLRVARNILEPLVSDAEARLELGRVHTLFCEVRCDRGRPGNLNGPNQPLTRMRQYMTGVAMETRPEEPCGGDYGEARAMAVERRVAAMLGDGEPEGSGDASV